MLAASLAFLETAIPPLALRMHQVSTVICNRSTEAAVWAASLRTSMRFPPRYLPLSRGLIPTWR
jgi:hypothetical protein